ncbi:hypothetical protein Sjap_007367 [Stephania japonica]|uniref:Uncharacterized protein n=1 Tax=Stephania japonica TaxID=461633 RepID=A0AAP0JP74_9MAGN
MAAAMAEGVMAFSMASVMEDVLQQHGTRLSDTDLASRKAEEAALRRYEAAGWLRKMVGVVGAKDLPAEPSEEEFRLGLRSGIILCNVLNKTQPGAVPKVVESPGDSIVVPDGAALSAYQYFENVRNFHVAMQGMGLPTFEASDLEQGGKSARIVNCVLALKSYTERKQVGANGSSKFGGNLKPSNSGKYFVRKNGDPFMNSLSRSHSLSADQNLNGDLVHDQPEPDTSLSTLVRAALSDKKPEEVPTLVESMLSKVMEEFERRLANHNEMMKTSIKDMAVSDSGVSLSKTAPGEVKVKVEEKNITQVKKVEHTHVNSSRDEELKSRLLRQQTLFDQQTRDVQELKHCLRTTRAGMQFMQMKYHEEFCNLGKHLHGLVHAASSYHRVLEENRKLYNQVQDLKGSIRVYCRVRPFLPGAMHRSSTVDYIEEGSISIITPSKYGKGHRSFNFNQVFGPSATQEEVFADTRPLIRSVLDGYNICIFAYGQTGSGKTFTMSGPKELTEQSQGVNYRALSDLFFLSEQRKDTFCYEVSVQMIEIYNEQVRDLLVTDGLNRRLEIRNSSQKGLSVPDASLVQVSSTSDVIELMNIGQRNRAVGATALNDRSSRSHSCLTVHVQGKDLTSGNVLRGCMHLVDLAGSERVDKSEVTGDRLKEAQHINKSLSALGDVIASLAQKNSHVPYRNSKLTQLLQDSLGGQAKTLMFVHISPEADAVGETISTLKFAERVATVELGAARVNKESGDVKELKEQIASLKAALAKKESGLEDVQRSISKSPERGQTKISESSLLHTNRQVIGDMSSGQGNRRQPMEDVGNIEAWSNSASRTKMPSFDLQDLLINSPPWPPVNSPGLNFQKDDEKEMGSGEWVDKVMVNRQDSLSGDNPLSLWEGENRQLPELFYQGYSLDSRVYPEQPSKKFVRSKKDSHDFDIQRSRFDMATTDDSDELEVATSDSSEPELLWQFNLPKVTSIPNSIGSKIKKPQSKLAKSPELSGSAVTKRSSSTLGPSLSRKLPKGIAASSLRQGRQPASVDGKRKMANGK